ncbi:MAG: hypothetical protein FJY76_03280 [Candidatus Aenigmarchaeota archaeon]|nr:hypothetical protein [Candidatus Aenigmarchaeota archaeon]
MVLGKKKAPKLPELPMPSAESPAEAEPRAPAKPAAPPLFIKIDKYRDVLKNVQELKSFSVGLRDAMDAIADVEHELKTGLEIANKALDRFNTLLALLDSKLIRIEGVEPADVQTPKEIDDYVKGLYDQIERIKHDLRTIE